MASDVPHIVLIAGEVSGDHIGSRIMQSLKKIAPHVKFSGSPGPSMREAGCIPWVSMESFQVMGLIDVVSKIPTIIRAKKELLRQIVQSHPDIILFIDQPSFSFHMAKKIHSLYRDKKRPLCIQVVAPSVWAYNPGRAEKLKTYFDAIFPLYQFEIPYFEKHLPTQWIGHPAMETWREKHKDCTELKHPVLALYPGSRPNEIRRNLPLFLDATKLIMKRTSHFSSAAIQYTKAISPEDISYIQQEIEKRGLSDCVIGTPFTERHELMKRAKGAFAKSGTVTLELALSHTPTVVTYKMGFITRLWAKLVLKITGTQKFSLPNILTRKEIFPEHIITPPNAETLSTELLHLLEKENISALNEAQSMIYHQIFPSAEKSSADIAAISILNLIQEKMNR